MNRGGRIDSCILAAHFTSNGLDRIALAAIGTAHHGCIIGKGYAGIPFLTAEVAWKPIAALVVIGGAGVGRTLQMSEDLCA